MTALQFESYWNTNYGGTEPLSHLFKFNFKNRWFRILYSDRMKKSNSNQFDWEKLLNYENRIITDLINNQTKLWGISGEYSSIDNFENPDFITKGLFSKYSFQELDPIDLNKMSPTEFKAGEIYRSFITELTWHSNKLNELLKAMAVDKVRMFFICLSPKCIIAPFDGGIDFVLENSLVKNELEKKYKKWMEAKYEEI